MDQGSSFLARTVHRLCTKAFKPKSASEWCGTRSTSHELQKTLTTVDVVLLGVGGIIGAGVFVLTGTAAKEDAGCACTHPLVDASDGKPSREHSMILQVDA